VQVGASILIAILGTPNTPDAVERLASEVL
jgi:hypothetical protein